MRVHTDFSARVFETERLLQSIFPEDVYAFVGFYKDDEPELIACTNSNWTDDLIANELYKKNPISGPVLLKKKDAVVEKNWDPGHKHVQNRKRFIGTDKGIGRIVRKGNLISSVGIGFESIYYDHKTLLNLLTDLFNRHFLYENIISNKLF